ncbi:hypothetical protein A0H81_11022 [Grifola frondosa]|uniref:BTB domain-containing protein n=1 Tax=Grifola frondosa TaxID=5627 RepID=A0A1C7LW31_GRIFR|nr:hypothetical protein A0H81_11022 [Grifola frondosa]
MAPKQIDSIALEDVRFLFRHDNALYASHLSHTAALTPFDKDDADVVLRSSDNVDFHAHKARLAFASPIFKDTFSIPQPIILSNGGDIHPETGLPLIRLQEDYRTLEILLQMCYPCQRMPQLLLDDVRPLLEAAGKYEMGDVIARIREILLIFVSTEPLRVFVIACNMGWEMEAKVAARAAPYAIPADLSSCRRGSRADITPAPMVLEERMHYTMLGIHDPPADIIIRSSNRIKFHAHINLLSIVSQKLACILHESPDLKVNAANRAPTNDLPVVEFPESGRILGLLLRLCYPISAPDLDARDIPELLEAAKKYEVPRAVDFARKRWKEYIRAGPLRAYFVAFARGWMDKAREAARYTVFLPKDDYIPEMETVSAEAYWRLLDYRRRISVALASALALNVTADIANTYDKSTSSNAFNEANGFNIYDRLEIGILLQRTTKTGLNPQTIVASIAKVVASQYHESGNPHPTAPRRDARAILTDIMELQERLDGELSKSFRSSGETSTHRSHQNDRAGDMMRLEDCNRYGQDQDGHAPPNMMLE